MTINRSWVTARVSPQSHGHTVSSVAYAFDLRPAHEHAVWSQEGRRGGVPPSRRRYYDRGEDADGDSLGLGVFGVPSSGDSHASSQSARRSSPWDPEDEGGIA
jgi:hypothetical protein